MRVKVENVSPAMARKWITASEGTRQRVIVTRRVDRLAHAIESGQWLVTHQGIAISHEGIVLDGMHRLHAIARTGATVPVMVARDADPGIFGVIDTGASRTPGDSLRIAGHTNANILAAMVRTILVYDDLAGTNGSRWSRASGEITTADVLKWLEDPDHVDAAHGAMTHGRRVATAVSRWGATTPLSSLYLIASTYPTDIGPSTLEEFYARVSDGVLLPARSPILAFRNWMVSDSGYMNLNHSTRRPVTIAMGLKALNDYALGVERSLSHFKFGVEAIPIPLPPGSIKAESKRREAELAAVEAAEA